MPTKTTGQRKPRLSKSLNRIIALLLLVSVTQLVSNFFILNKLPKAAYAVDAAGKITWDDVIAFLNQAKSTTSNVVLSPTVTQPTGTVAAVTPTAAPTAQSNANSVTAVVPSLVVGQAANINLKVSQSTPRQDVVVDFEIYNQSGAKIFQKFFEHQNFALNSTADYQINWTPGNNGSYILKAGIFSPDWKQTLYWADQVTTLNLANAQVQSANPNPTPTTVAVNNQNQAQTSVVSNQGGGTYTVGADGRIYKNGQKIALSGISWFGAETDTKVPHGLWQRNYKEYITQIKSLGFNAVRLPYCPAAVQNTEATGIDTALNPDLVGLKSLDVMDKIVNEFNRQGIYIMMDNHRPDCYAQSDLWYTGSYSEDQWINDLVNFATRYKNLEYFVGLDLKNEPKGSATWGTGNQATDWNLAVERAGKKILAANSNILLFVDGIENNPVCSDNTLGHWWGGNLEPVACKDLDSSAVPANKVVFAPHAYGPDTYNQPYFNIAAFPGNLPAIWDQHFGFLKSKGKALAIGEYGGKYGAGDPKDAAWQNAFVDYLSSKGICDNFYWTLNPNSGDTGGILQDDWKSVNQGKVDLLTRYRNQCK